ncbi:MAG: hypothetical protein SGPRY_007671, partial [Prymnesium sp.]
EEIDSGDEGADVDSSDDEHQQEDGEEEEEEEEGAGGEQEESSDNKINKEGQVWRPREANFVKVDARTEPRSNSSLNKGDITIGSIVQMFHYFVPLRLVGHSARAHEPEADGCNEGRRSLELR